MTIPRTCYLDNILDKFEFVRSWVNVKVAVTIFRRKKMVITLVPLIFKPSLILYHTNVLYDNILDKFEFERSRAKVKVIVAIFRKTLSWL